MKLQGIKMGDTSKIPAGKRHRQWSAGSPGGAALPTGSNYMTTEEHNRDTALYVKQHCKDKQQTINKYRIT